MLSDSAKRYIRRIAQITAVVFLGFLGFIGHNAWQYYKYMDEIEVDEDIAIKSCINIWGAFIELSRDIETRLQTQMPNPQQYLVMKSGGINYGGAFSFIFLGIDDTRGYLLSNLYGYTGLIEQSYARKDAQALFDQLTQGFNNARLTGYSDDALHPSCFFVKIASPTSSIQLQFIGTLFHAPKDHAGVKFLKKLNKFSYEAVDTIHLSQTLDARRKAITASSERERKAKHSQADYDNQVKRSTENIFFELPDGK